MEKELQMGPRTHLKQKGDRQQNLDQACNACRFTVAPRGGGTGGRVGRGARRTRATVRRINEIISELYGQENEQGVEDGGSNEAIDNSKGYAESWYTNRQTSRNGSLKKNTEKRGNDGEPSRDMIVKDDNKRSRTGNAFVTTANLVRREYTGTTPKCTNCNLHHLPESPCRAYLSCNRLGHLAKDCRVVLRMVNLLNARNPTAARGACFESGGTDHFKAACPRAFMLGEEEALQDLDIMTSTFTLNNHYATRLFDFGADYIFVSTAFTPLLGIESSNLGFSYEIEIANEKLVEIDKVIRGCELKIEGHTFSIDLIPFGSRSFDVIVGVDWLSKHKAEIILHERVVRIPLHNGKTLRVKGEKPEEKFLGHVINGDGIHVNLSKIKFVINWEAPKTLSEKSKTFDWDEEQEMEFQTLKDKLCNVPVLALLDRPKDFVMYCDASGLGLGCVLMQRGVVRCGKKRKLAPRYVGAFEMTERIGHVAYRLRLPKKLNGVHDTFHVSSLKKCLADPTLQIPLDEIRIDAKLNFVEEPI
uniref:Uncharacterized protein n=1 Tax=Tanacetum cinerariifolium TaxID=118510 RepID=A0A6L2NES5_TANCI|nr:hypothetical protein [Tanacetum cinerariifolium]